MVKVQHHLNRLKKSNERFKREDKKRQLKLSAK